LKRILTSVSINGGVYDTSTTVVATTAATTLYSVPHASFRSAKFFVQTQMGSDYVVRELLAIHNGTNGYITEYAIVSTNEASAAMSDVFEADISGSNFIFRVVAFNATSRTIVVNVTLL
jgi:hypothetical protein